MGDKGDLLANHQAWGHLDGTENWRMQGQDENPGVLLIPVKNYLCATWYLLMAVLYEVCATIFSVPNFKISNDRLGLTRSAILLILFIVIHAVGNLHVFLGPDDFNGYGYFYVRLYWTGFGLPANIVEEYILLSALLHVFVALKRTWDLKLKMGIASGQLNLAISGVLLLTFMTIHLFQFRFGETQPYNIRPPPYLINIWGILALNLFWCTKEQCPYAPTVAVRDIYKLEFDIFQLPTSFPFGSSCGKEIPLIQSLGMDAHTWPRGAKFLGRILHLLNRHFHDPRLLGLEEGGPSTGHSHGSPQMREHHWLHDLHRAWSNLHFIPSLRNVDAQALVRMGGRERESLERTVFSVPAYRSLRLKGPRLRAVPQNSWCR